MNTKQNSKDSPSNEIDYNLPKMIKRLLPFFGLLGLLIGFILNFQTSSTIKSIINSYITPTINYKTEDPECDLDYTTKSETKKNINHAISNNFGFGGHNASIVISKFIE